MLLLLCGQHLVAAVFFLKFFLYVHPQIGAPLPALLCCHKSTIGKLPREPIEEMESACTEALSGSPFTPTGRVEVMDTSRHRLCTEVTLPECADRQPSQAHRQALKGSRSLCRC